MRRRAGFTLIELVVVVLIMGILTTAAVPRYATSLNFHRAQSAATRLVADLQRISMAARKASQPRIVHFDIANGRYLAFPGIQGLDSGEQPIYEVSTAQLYGTDISSAQFVDGPWFVFNGLGLPESNGRVVFTAGGKSAVVIVDLDNGDMYVEE